MADNNIIIKITSESDLNAAQKQLQELTNKIKEQEKAIADLSELEKQDADSIKKSVFNREKLSKALAENKRYYAEEKKAVKEQIAAAKSSIKEFDKQVKAYKVLHGESGRMVQQLRAMREELQRMEDSGEFGTQAFNDLAIAAAKLEDQIGDTQQRIRILSSDTLGLDTAMGVADGVAGTFYIATSAAELFGGEMEGLQKAFYKVQAAMSTLNGLQQVANALNKDSVIMVNLRTAAEKIRQRAAQKAVALERLQNIQKIQGVATDGARTVSTGILTKAQWALNAAMAANPIGAIITACVAAVAAIGALAYAIYKLVDANSDAAKAEEAHTKALKDYEIAVRNANTATKSREVSLQMSLSTIDQSTKLKKARAEAEGKSELELLKIEKDAAEERLKLYQKNYDAYEESLKNKEKAAREALDAAGKLLDEMADEDGMVDKEYTDQYHEAANNWYEVLGEIAQATNELYAYTNESLDAEKAYTMKLLELREELTESSIRLMKEGQEKEIAQIEQNYKKRYEAIKGNTEEEMLLRTSLMLEESQEILKIKEKYLQKTRETELLELQNTLNRKKQKEADYKEQYELAKQIAEKEASVKISALNQEEMGVRAYAAEVEAINIELYDRLQQIESEYDKHFDERAERLEKLYTLKAEVATMGLTGEETVEEQKRVWQEYYDEREDQLKSAAEREKDLINKSTDTELEKEIKIRIIEKQLEKDLLDLKKESAEKLIDIDAQYIDELKRNVEQAETELANASESGKLQAQENYTNAQKELLDAQLVDLKSRYKAGLITYQEYKQQEWELTKATTDAEVEYVQSKMQVIADSLTTALEYMQQVSDLAFEAINNNIQAQMDALNEMYTTDAQEAKENANKKYISEKELADKKAALEMKQAKYAKAQALINAAINTALAITAAMPNWIAVGMAAAMGAAQIGIIASKPLAQYEKGRKGGKGEYALVGEKGPEIMYVPEGASIVPNHYLGDMDAWSKFGVPALPNDMMLQTINIDYDRLGKAVAANIPQQKAVSVNVDRRGVTISDDGNRRTYLNHKYAGSWS